MVDYGQELILDLHNCEPRSFTYYSVRDFFRQLCERIGMERCGFAYVESEPGDDEDPKTHGLSAVQFIVKSSITIHCLDKMSRVYLNVFSCDSFDRDEVEQFAVGWFGGTRVKCIEVART